MAGTQRNQTQTELHLRSERFRRARQKGKGEMDRETRYRVIYFDENDKEVYNEDFHTFNDMLVEGQPLTPPPHIKRTEVWMTHLL
jgi:hypothetical protein